MINQLSSKNILVIGDIMLDQFLICDFVEQSKEYTDTPIFHILQQLQFAGGAANVVNNLVGLNCNVSLIAALGNDNHATQLLQQLLDCNTQSLIQDDGITTTTKTRIFNQEQAVCRVDDEQKLLKENIVHSVNNNIVEYISNNEIDAIILQDYNKGVLQEITINCVLELAQERNIPVFVDPKLNNWNCYKKVTLFKPNQKEFEYFIGEKVIYDLDFLNEKAKQLQQELQFEYLLLTLGSYGNYILHNGEGIITPQNNQIANADVCSAGDAVLAITTLAILNQFSLQEIANLANKIGAIVCKHQYTYAIGIEDL
ncbi:MAG: PfkB family carbohydrate kinase [Chitinophagales bacterium]